MDKERSSFLHLGTYFLSGLCCISHQFCSAFSQPTRFNMLVMSVLWIACDLFMCNKTGEAILNEPFGQKNSADICLYNNNSECSKKQTFIVFHGLFTTMNTYRDI